MLYPLIYRIFEKRIRKTPSLKLVFSADFNIGRQSIILSFIAYKSQIKISDLRVFSTITQQFLLLLRQ